MWEENKTIASIVKLFFNKEIGEGKYILEGDDLIYHQSTPKSGLNSWVRLDKNSKKSVRLRIINLYEKYALNENNELINEIKPGYKKPDKESVLVSLNFSKMIISKDENKALKKMKQINREWYEVGLIEETIIKYQGENYYIIWD